MRITKYEHEFIWQNAYEDSSTYQLRLDDASTRGWEVVNFTMSPKTGRLVTMMRRPLPRLREASGGFPV